MANDATNLSTSFSPNQHFTPINRLTDINPYSGDARIMNAMEDN
jgi:hypothetical protein